MNARVSNVPALTRVVVSPAHVAIGGSVALALAMGVGRFAFTPILPMMQSDSGVSLSQGGWLAAANYAGYLAGALSAVLWRIEPRTAIRTGLIVVAVSTGLMGLARDLAPWLMLRALAGTASAWVLISTSAWVFHQLAPLERPVLTAAVFSGVGVGIAVAGTVCLALMAAGIGSAGVWAVLGLLTAATSALAWPLYGKTAARHPRDPTARRGAGIVDRDAVRRMVACYGAFGFGYVIPATFLPAMARQLVSDPLVFGWAWPLFGAAAAVSTVAVARFVPRTADRSVWAANALVMAVGVGLPALWNGLPAIMVASLAVGGTFMVITMVGLREAGALPVRTAVD